MKTFLLVATLLVAATSPLLAQPALEIIGGTTKDWGIVKQVTKPLTAQIALKNIGTKELVIASVTPSCGCTTAPIEQSRLAPGASTHVNITLNLNPTAVGQQIKTITIASNDAAKPTQVFTLKAEIMRSLQPSANFIALPSTRAGRQVSSSIRLKNTTVTPMKITEIIASDGLKPRRKAPFVIAPQSDTEFAIDLRPDAKSSGYFHSQILIKTDNADQPTLPLNVYGDIKPATKAAK